MRFHVAWLAGAFVPVLFSAALAQLDQPKELWRLKLSKEQRVKVSNGIAETDKLRAAREFDQAEEAARKVVTLVGGTFGADHWETREAQSLVDMIKPLRETSVDDHAKFEKAFSRKEVNEAIGKGDLQKAAGIAERDHEICEKLLGGEHPETVRLLRSFGSRLYEARQFKRAEKVLLQAEKLVDSQSPSPSKSNYYHALAIASHKLQNHDKSFACFDKMFANSAIVFAPYDSLAIEQRTDYCTVLSKTRRFKKASAEFQRLRQLVAKEHGDPSPELCRVDLAIVEHEITDRRYPDAYKKIVPAITLLMKHAPEGELVAKYKTQFARLLTRVGRHDSAACMYEGLVEDRLHDSSGVNAYADVLNKSGDPVAAEKYLLKNLDYSNKNWDGPVLSKIYANYAYGAFLEQHKRQTEAVTHYRKAIAIGEEMEFGNAEVVISARADLARLVMRTSEEQSAKLVKISREYASKDPNTRLVVERAAAQLSLQQGNRKEALRVIRAAIKEAGDPERLVPAVYLNCRHDEARYLYGLGRYDEAEQLLKKVLKSLGSFISFQGDGVDYHRELLSTGRELAGTLIKLKRPADAWQAYEASKALSLRTELYQSDMMSADERKELASLGRDVRLCEDKLVVAKAGQKQLTPSELRDLVISLREARLAHVERVSIIREKYALAVGQGALDLARVQSRLAPDAAIVTWLDYNMRSFDHPESEHWACVVRKKGPPTWVPLVPLEQAWSKQDHELPDDLVKVVQSPRDDATKLSQQVYRQRVDPVLPHLSARDGMPKVKQLVIVPNNKTSGFPIECLTSSENRRVLDDFVVSYAHSATVYCQMSEKRLPDRPKSLLAIVNPGGDLAGSERTAELLEGYFEKSSMLAGVNASERQVSKMAGEGVAKKFTHIHFGAHGAPSSIPMKSAIELRPSKASLAEIAAGNLSHDGLLSAEEIANWQLDAELVTIACCRSNIGWLSRSEGYVGLPQGFFIAGAKSVVVSLWDVEDNATSLLMDRFYGNLLGKNQDRPLTKAESLREAKLWLSALSYVEVNESLVKLRRKDAVKRIRIKASKQPTYAHPSFWAGFVLFGDPN